MTKRERLAKFFERLSTAVPVANQSDAFALIADALNAIENEFAGDDDRMFPPSGDFWHPVEGRSDLDLYRQAAHDTIVRNNGAILIRVRKTFAVVFEKPGQDRRKVDL